MFKFKVRIGKVHEVPLNTATTVVCCRVKGKSRIMYNTLCFSNLSGLLHAIM